MIGPTIRRLMPLLTCVAGLVSVARAAIPWTPPQPAELSMQEEPKAPGAAVIVLSYQRDDDANSGKFLVHVRLKILTSAGLSAANITLARGSYDSDQPEKQFFARTIHRDGTVVPFRSTPQNTVMIKDTQAITISLPGAEVGSILEYVVVHEGHFSVFTELSDFYEPYWNLQQHYFTREERFTLESPGALSQDAVRWVGHLPVGTEIHHVKHQLVLELADVPPVPDEAFMPPLSLVSYYVSFFYYSGPTDDYWGNSAADVEDVWSKYEKPRGSVTKAVEALVQPNDTEEAKLHKIYDAVMEMENTDYTRHHSREEDVKDGLRSVSSSDDVLINRRGDSGQLTLLFIAMARAAGLHAYPFAVTSRDAGRFDKNVLSWSQMDTLLAIVQVNGRDYTFDPGTPFCPFAQFAPNHAGSGGLSIEGKIGKFRSTPPGSYKSSQVERVAELKLDRDGSITGTLHVSWLNLAAMPIRQAALLDGPDEEKRTIEQALQLEAPEGVLVKIKSIDGLRATDTPLTATVELSGKLGTSTSKRVLLPSFFLETRTRPALTATERTTPVSFVEAYTRRDLMTIALPPGLSVESLPKNQKLDLGKNGGEYIASSSVAPAKAGDNGSTLTTVRVSVLNALDYEKRDYSTLREYFSSIAARDQEEIILHVDEAKPTQ